MSDFLVMARGATEVISAGFFVISGTLHLLSSFVPSATKEERRHHWIAGLLSLILFQLMVKP